MEASSNAVDYASWGLLSEELLTKALWWEGPPWLMESPDHWPDQLDLNPAAAVPELRHVMSVSALPHLNCGSDILA